MTKKNDVEVKALMKSVEEVKGRLEYATEKVSRLEEGLKAFLEAPQYKAFNEQILYKEQTPIRKVSALDSIGVKR